MRTQARLSKEIAKAQDDSFDLFLENSICNSEASAVRGKKYRKFRCSKHQAVHYVTEQHFTDYYRRFQKSTFLKRMLINSTEQQRSYIYKQVRERAHNKYYPLFKLTNYKGIPLPPVLKPVSVAPKKSSIKQEQVKPTKVEKKNLSSENETKSSRKGWPDSYYIIPVQLLSDDVLLDFYLCGRKKKFTNQEEILNHAHIRADIYEPYLCPHCNFYHAGRKSGSATPKSRSRYISNGKYWYRLNYELANKYIWSIFMEK